jgi:hypothetical protein
MKHFWYSIADDEIKAYLGEIEAIPPGFIELNSSASVYYKIKDTKITDAIGDAIHEPAARRRVQEFISALNASLI